MKEKVLMCWSGGKDSAMALFELQKLQKFEVVALLTTVTQDYERISMHGVRRVLLEQQAASLGIPLEIVFISKNCSNQDYESKMQAVLEKYKLQGVTSVVFGDIFLEDLKKYREENLAKLNLKGIFPLWKKDTLELAQAFQSMGFKAIVTCIDSFVLGKEFAGMYFNKTFIEKLPLEIDPCGENGEFHSFAFAGPIFKKEISFTVGETVLRDNRFYFCDLLPT